MPEKSALNEEQLEVLGDLLEALDRATTSGLLDHVAADAPKPGIVNMFCDALEELRRGAWIGTFPENGVPSEVYFCRSTFDGKPDVEIVNQGSHIRWHQCEINHPVILAMIAHATQRNLCNLCGEDLSSPLQKDHACWRHGATTKR